MQFIDDKVCLVNVNVDYLRELHRISEEVPYTAMYQNKPFLGVLIQNGDVKYVIPLSSAKEKHKKWRDESQDYFLIYEIVSKSAILGNDIYTSANNNGNPNQVKHILSVLDLKKMIPVASGVYRQVYVNEVDSDAEDMKKYKNLLEKELQFCIKIKSKILEKAEKLYLKQKQKGNVRFCVDFSAVEKACKDYNSPIEREVNDESTKTKDLSF